MQRRKERRHMTHPCHITELRTHDRPAPLRGPFLEQVDHYTDLFRQIRAALPPEQAEAVEAIMCGPFYDGPHSPDAATQPVPPQPPRAERQRGAPPSPPPDGLRTPAEAARKPSKPRRQSISKMIEQAEKTGKPLASLTLPDGTKLDFGKPDLAEPENAWPLDEFRTKETKQ